MQIKVHQKQIQSLAISEKYKNAMLDHLAKYIRKTKTPIIAYEDSKALQQSIDRGKAYNLSQQRLQQNKLNQRENAQPQLLKSGTYSLSKKFDHSKHNPQDLAKRNRQQSILGNKKQQSISLQKQDPISICLKHIKVCSKAIKQQKLKEAQIIIDFIHKTLGQMCYKQENYKCKTLKIRAALLRLELLFNKVDSKKINKTQVITKKQVKFIQRIPLFCKQLKKDQGYYQQLQQDYYSYIEILHFTAIRSCLFWQEKARKNKKDHLTNCQQQKTDARIKNLGLITGFIEDGRTCLLKQLNILCSLLENMEDKKIFRIITQKCGTLLKFYGLELAVMYINDAAQAQTINQESQQSIKQQNAPKEDNQRQQNKLDMNIYQLENKQELHIRRKIAKIKSKIWWKYEKIIKDVPNSLNEIEIQNIVVDTFMTRIQMVASLVSKSTENNLLGKKNDQSLSDQLLNQIQDQYDEQFIQQEDEDIFQNFGSCDGPKQAKEGIETILQQPCQEEMSMTSQSDNHISQNKVSHANSSHSKTFITDQHTESKLSTSKQIYLANLCSKMQYTQSGNRLNYLKIRRNHIGNQDLMANQTSGRTNQDSESGQNTPVIIQREQKPEEQHPTKRQTKNFFSRPSILIRHTNQLLNDNSGFNQMQQIQTIQLFKASKQKKESQQQKISKQKKKKKVTIVQSYKHKSSQKNKSSQNQDKKKKLDSHSKPQNYLNLPALANSNQQRVASIQIKCTNRHKSEDQSKRQSFYQRNNLLTFEDKKKLHYDTFDKNQVFKRKQQNTEMKKLTQKSKSIEKSQRIPNKIKLRQSTNLSVFRMAKSVSLLSFSKNDFDKLSKIQILDSLSVQCESKSRKSKSLSLFIASKAQSISKQPDNSSFNQKKSTPNSFSYNFQHPQKKPKLLIK